MVSSRRVRLTRIASTSTTKSTIGKVRFGKNIKKEVTKITRTPTRITTTTRTTIQSKNKPTQILSSTRTILKKPTVVRSLPIQPTVTPPRKATRPTGIPPREAAQPRKLTQLQRVFVTPRDASPRSKFGIYGLESGVGTKPRQAPFEQQRPAVLTAKPENTKRIRQQQKSKVTQVATILREVRESRIRKSPSGLIIEPFIEKRFGTEPTSEVRRKNLERIPTNQTQPPATFIRPQDVITTPPLRAVAFKPPVANFIGLGALTGSVFGGFVSSFQASTDADIEIQRRRTRIPETQPRDDFTIIGSQIAQDVSKGFQDIRPRNTPLVEQFTNFTRNPFPFSNPLKPTKRKVFDNPFSIGI